MVSASRTPPKSIKNGSKKVSKTDHLKMYNFRVLGPARRRKVSKRAPQRDPEGSLRDARKAKNESREGLKIHLVSQVVPEKAPRSQGGLRGVLFGSFSVNLLGSCVTGP